MPAHTAKSLFDMNVQSSDDLLQLYDGIEKLGTKLNISWLLRAVVVFSVSALDAYFHDKIKYRAARFSPPKMPVELAKFEVPLGDLLKWETAKRKGNVIRNWLTEHFATRPLQRKEDIDKALKLVDIPPVWSTIEPIQTKQKAMIEEIRAMIRRRNQIAHEGDRGTSRKSGKRLRPINREQAERTLTFTKELVARIEKAFPY